MDHVIFTGERLLRILFEGDIMNILGNNYINSDESNNQSLNTNYNIGTNKSCDAGNVQNTTVNSLSEGQIFKGTITNIANDNVTITLDNLKEIVARLDGMIDYNIGDMTYFEVLENSGDRVVIHPVENSGIILQNQTINKALSVSGLTLNKKNALIVKELMDASLPIDKQSIINILKDSVNFPDTSLRTLVTLNKFQIPINEGNINMFNDYVNMNHQIRDEIGNFLDNVINVMKEENHLLSKEQIISINEKLLKLDNNENLYNIENKESVREELINTENSLGSHVDKLTDGFVIKSEINNSLDDKQVKIILNNMELNSETVANIGENEIVSSIINNIGMSKESLIGLTNQLEIVGIPNKDIIKLITSTGSQSDLMKQINTYINENISDIDAIRNYFSSREHLSLLKSTLQDNLFISKDDINKPEAISKFYNKLITDMEKISKALSQDTKASEIMLKSATNVKQNVEFMNGLNNMFTYFQLPVKLNNNKFNSELYVYTNKKNVKKDSKEISVLLHLDMDNLGPIDVHVNLSNTNVHTRFYLNDQDSINIARSNISQLEDNLGNLGFSFTNEFNVRTVERNIITEAFANATNNTINSVKRYNFDVRM